MEPSSLTRPNIRGRFGVAGSTHWLAAQTAMQMLEQGGNAFDGAVASGFVLQAAEPHFDHALRWLRLHGMWDARQGQAGSVAIGIPDPASGSGSEPAGGHRRTRFSFCPLARFIFQERLSPANSQSRTASRMVLPTRFGQEGMIFTSLIHGPRAIFLQAIGSGTGHWAPQRALVVSTAMRLGARPDCAEASRTQGADDRTHPMCGRRHSAR